MKRFDQIANNVFRNLLEVGPMPGMPGGVATSPGPGLPQDGGPVAPIPGMGQAPTPTAKKVEPDVERSPREKQNYETEILNLAKNALYVAVNDPDSISESDRLTLTTPVTIDNKDKMLELLKRIAEYSA